MTRSVVTGGGSSEAPLKGCVQSEREIRPALDYVGWEVRWPASIGSDPEAIVGGYSSYRLVVRFDTDCGKFTSVMTQRAGSQEAFTER